MVIVLFLFVILFFPIKFTTKIRIDIKNAYFCATLFFMKICIINLHLISYNGLLYYSIGRIEPKPLKFKRKGKKTNTPINYDFFKGEKVVADVFVGITPFANSTVLPTLSIFSPILCHIIDERLTINFHPDFVEKNVKSFITLTTYTFLGLIIFQFFKKAIKGVKNAIQQSN